MSGTARDPTTNDFAALEREPDIDHDVPPTGARPTTINIREIIVVFWYFVYIPFEELGTFFWLLHSRFSSDVGYPQSFKLVGFLFIRGRFLSVVASRLCSYLVEARSLPTTNGDLSFLLSSVWHKYQ